MKKLVAKLRTKSFWVALIGALTLILTRLGISDAAGVAEKIAEAVGSVLLVFGLAVSPAAEKSDKDTATESESGEPDSESQSDNPDMQ